MNKTDSVRSRINAYTRPSDLDYVNNKIQYYKPWMETSRYESEYYIAYELRTSLMPFYSNFHEVIRKGITAAFIAVLMIKT